MALALLAAIGVGKQASRSGSSKRIRGAIKRAVKKAKAALKKTRRKTIRTGPKKTKR